MSSSKTSTCAAVSGPALLAPAFSGHQTVDAAAALGSANRCRPAHMTREARTIKEILQLVLENSALSSCSTREGEILTIKQVAEYLKVTERTIYRLAAAKKIPAFKVGGTWRFSQADIDSWIKQQSMEGLDTGRDSAGEAGEQIQDREKK